MTIDPKYLEVNYEGAGIRNSQKRLKDLITSLAVEPITQFEDELSAQLDLVEQIVQRRVASVIVYWSQNKHDPLAPSPKDMMSEITNATKNDMSLADFYKDQVWNGMHTLAPTLNLDVPDDYTSATDELEYALMELEEQVWAEATINPEDAPPTVAEPDEESTVTDEEPERSYYEDVDLTSYDIVDDDYFEDDPTVEDPYIDYAENEPQLYTDYAEEAQDDIYAEDEALGVVIDKEPFIAATMPQTPEADTAAVETDIPETQTMPAVAELASDSQDELEETAVAEPIFEPVRRQVTEESRPAVAGAGGGTRLRRTFNLDGVPAANDAQPVVDLQEFKVEGDFAALANLVNETEPVEEVQAVVEAEQSIVSQSAQNIQQAPPQQVDVNVLNITAEHAWQLTYGLMGYTSEYIQGTMLPRWQQYPGTFEKDRRYLYNLFIDTIRNAAGLQVVAGNFTFSDRNITIDQLWQSYYADLSRNSAPQLTAARLDADANDPAWRKLWKRLRAQTKNISPIWLLALGIALIFDGLTTYVSLEQTPMEGIIVPIFTVLITALFQIADQLVIDYRRREFDADALVAKFKAQSERIAAALAGLETSSESFVQLSMEKSKVMANWKAAEDNRKMAKRGNFWSARIADINVIVTAYGFAFIFLDSSEPMFALAQQIDYIFFQQAWEQVNLWVFLMIGLAVTVSFVVNTAQRTEILGWSMRRMKQEA